MTLWAKDVEIDSNKVRSMLWHSVTGAQATQEGKAALTDTRRSTGFLKMVVPGIPQEMHTPLVDAWYKAIAKD